MATKKKLLQAAAGSAGGAGGLDIPDVFSTYLYSGNSSAQTITNGIDLDGEGGLWWLKVRSQAGSHLLYDSTRATGSEHFPLFSNLSNAEYDDLDTTPTSTGFTINSTSSGTVNETGQDYTSWTWRKAPKFFDVVTWTGNGVAGRTISHNLNSEVGMMLVKCTSATGNWWTYHRSLGENKYLLLNSTQAQGNTGFMWNATAPTSTEFTLGDYNEVNGSGKTFVAYLFAHNDGDGEFGPDSDQDIIKCGSYTGNGSSTGPEIDLGFEPQWLLIKKATGGAQSWAMYDTMRGITSGGDDALLFADTTSDELTSYASLSVTSTGFKLDATHDWVNTSGETYIYIAIRRGQLAVPEDATDVFNVTTRDATVPAFNAPFSVDMALYKSNITSAEDLYISSRLTQGKVLVTHSTSPEVNGSAFVFDYNDGWYGSASANSNAYSWMWKRAPGFFDAVTYTGNSTNGRQLKHNLGVVPEFFIVRSRDATKSWYCYHKGIDFNGDGRPETDYAVLNTTQVGDYDGFWNDTAPTEEHIVLGNDADVNGSGSKFLVYLFASLDGISKVGSYTGNGSSQTINCGFTNGARFVLIRRVDSGGSWYFFDSERGIVSGNDPYLRMNANSAQVANWDIIDPDSSGFIVNQDGNNQNVSGGNYIFYAIA